MSNANASIFRKLHINTLPLRLPNAWDAGSARLIESLGAPAVATTSAGVAWALGYRDSRGLPVEEVVALASRMLRVVKVPLTFDIENGYADEPAAVAALVQRLADLGVAGINLEDGNDAPAVAVAKLEAIRNTLARGGADVFVNMRTDVVLAGLVEPAKQVEETIRRGQSYAAAGADGFFVPGLHQESGIRAVVAGVALPLNLMAWPGLADAANLGAWGVRRLSAGAAISQVAWGVVEGLMRDFLESGASGQVLAGAKSYAELQALFADR